MFVFVRGRKPVLSAPKTIRLVTEPLNINSQMKKNFITVLAIFAAATLALTSSGFAQGGKEPWVQLFNGKDFTGWNQKGGKAAYAIENGEIVGTSVWDTPNSFMCTDKLYGDFILELEVKVDNRLNSGIQIRSNSFPDYQAGRVHGYQVEIDPSDRAWSGGIYDEGRRGWLYTLQMNEAGRTAFKKEEWNKYRIEAIGNNIKTWINGVPCANVFDQETASGFIALQVHSIHDSAVIGTQVRWKNIRIITKKPAKYATVSTAPEFSRLLNQLTENEKTSGWKLLFDGSTTAGWRGAHKDAFPESGWKIENGVITVLKSGGAESKNGGDIVTVDEYANFDLQLEFKITEGANSGIKYYVTENEQSTGSAIGLEFQILDDAKHPDAKLGSHEGSRTLGSLYDLIKAENKRFAGVGVWNHARVVSNGTHVEHWLNGIKIVEYERGSEAFRKLVSESKYKDWENFGEAAQGHILLQDHGDEVSFRSIKIKVL